MERIVIPKIEICGVILERLNLFLDDEKNLILLPFLWAIHISNTGSVFQWLKTSSYSKFQTKKSTSSQQHLVNRSISDNTIRNYLGHVFKFLQFINKSNLSSSSPSVHRTELLTSTFINNYLNNELPSSLCSINSLNAHQAAINSYLNFLFELEIKDICHISVLRKTKQKMAEVDTRLKKINYISTFERSQLMKACGSHRDKLIIRLGYEIGLRTSELCGLLLRKKNEKPTSTRKGLLNLIFELVKHPTQMSFAYSLEGKYTKRSRTRNIYFSRELLQSMKDYYETERLIIEKNSFEVSDALLLRFDYEGFGQPIGKAQGTNTFAKLRKQFSNMNETLSYHDLRHTFGTELYHQELMDAEGHETRSESAALISVSERLGHTDTKTTKAYIRLRLQMVMIEDQSHG